MKKINVKTIIYVIVRDICPHRSFLGEKRGEEDTEEGRGTSCKLLSCVRLLQAAEGE